MNIFLVGFMGSGKSSLGVKMARRLGREFIDLDQAITDHEGMSISEIFDQNGEEHFRKVESNLLKRFTSDMEAVVALGGGSPCSEENWAFVASNGIGIYIRERPEVLYGRLKKKRSERPLIKGLSDTELRQFIDVKLTERERYYLRCDFIYEKEKTTWSFLMKQLEAYIK